MRRFAHNPKSGARTIYKIRKILLAVLGTIIIATLEVLILREIRSHSRQSLDFELFQQYPGERTYNRSPDGYFNGYPVFYQEVGEDDSLSSQIHCIGETHAEAIKRKFVKYEVDRSWTARSCHFQFFCFDMDTKEYVIFPNVNTIPSANGSTTSNHTFESQSTVFTNRTVHGFPYGVSIGGINRKWADQGIPRMQWFPRVEYHRRPTNFYTLPSEVTLIPYHSFAAFNPGHLLWDDFLPIFALAQIFDLEYTELLPLRYSLPGEPLWASCDWGQRKDDCNLMMRKFYPLLIRNPRSSPLVTQHTVPLHLFRKSSNNNNDHNDSKKNANSYPSSQLVCARHGLAGLGTLTDHDMDRGHGREPRDYEVVHNHGRGAQFWRFRNFLLHNLGVLTTDSNEPPASPYRIIFSERSSNSETRSLQFHAQISALYAAGIGTNATGHNNNNNSAVSDVRIESYRMNQYTLLEQAEMVSQAAIYVTGCGGGTVTATFLPRGSSTILFYLQNGGASSDDEPSPPARLDWDYFNNMGYSRVHWFVQEGKDNPDSLDGFVKLVSHQLDILRQQRVLYDASLEL